jgi:hypothetical protein
MAAVEHAHLTEWLRENHIKAFGFHAQQSVMAVSIHELASTRRNKSVTLVSGGLESMMLALGACTTQTDFRFVYDAHDYAHARGEHIEHLLLLALGSAGYETIVYGIERNRQQDLTGPAAAFSAWSFRAYPLNISMPYRTISKYMLFLEAVDQGIQFCSCEKGLRWCGDCFKCFQIASFYQLSGRASPIAISDERRENHLRELREFKATDVDPFGGDTQGFVWAERQAGVTLETAWRGVYDEGI